MNAWRIQCLIQAGEGLVLEKRYDSSMSQGERISRRAGALLGLLLCCAMARGQEAAPSNPQERRGLGTVSGVVKDVGGTVVVGAHVKLGTQAAAEQETVTDDAGEFRFGGVGPGIFALIVSEEGLATESISGTLHAGEHYEMPAVELRVATAVQSVDAMTRQDIAEAEIKEQEKQRVIGVVPNFFVSYNWTAEPLTAKQKFELGWHATFDPTHFVFAAVGAGIEQWNNDYPGFGGGWSGYGKRYGASLADSTTGTLIRGSIMPAVFHQDPRYFYKGTGSVKSRSFYALSTAVRARGDNGHWQISSGILAGFASGAISNFYYAPSDRHGANLTLENGAISIAGVGVGHLLQEFLYKRFTAKAAKGGAPVP